MKYSETSFYGVDGQFVAFEMSDRMREFAGTLYDENGNEMYPGTEDANCILMYGYIDHEAGVTLEVLAMGREMNEQYIFFEGNPEVRNVLRIGYAEDEEFFIVDDKNGELNKRFAERIEMLEAYKVNDNVMRTRGFEFLDKLRHKWFVDDVQVDLMYRGLNTERCWVRIEDLNPEEHCFIGTLLNEPHQDFGYHKGDTVAFFANDDGKGNIVCFTNLTPDVILTEEDLADGRLLEKTIADFKADMDADKFAEVVQLLRDSYVWVPCTVVFGDQDYDQIEKMIKESDENGAPDSLVGMKFSTQDVTRLIPDILTNGEINFFPVFSSIEAMGEYGEHFSHVQKHMLEVIPLALNNEKDIKGILVNAFTEPFILDKEVFDILRRTKSRIKRELS